MKQRFAFYFMLFVIVYSYFIVLVNCFDPCNKNFEIISDVQITDCGTEHFFIPTGNPEYKCLPRCKENYKIEFTSCETKGCPPGSSCRPKNNQELRCQVDEKSCFRNVFDSPENKWFGSEWKPECNTDGTWKAKQCKPNEKSGRCFCYDKGGNRIYGEGFASKTANMTCACSRKKAELMEVDSGIYPSLHCDEIGNYEPLQCMAGQCWCVKSATGEITSKVIPEKLMTYLPCYSEKVNGKTYLRQCESEEYAKDNIIRELKAHGGLFANLPHISCDFDGSYGPYQIESAEVRCVWKDRSGLGYAASKQDSDYKTITCNCARDKKIYELAGMAHLLVCHPSGDYNPLQKTDDGEYYCVDSDGHRKTKNNIDLKLKDCLEVLQ